MAIEKLYLSKEVAANTEECDTHVVENGKNVKILAFHGEGAFDMNVAIKAVWDYSGTEEILWSIEGSGSMPNYVTSETEKTGNGTKKMALCLDNGTNGPVVLSGTIVLEIDD